MTETESTEPGEPEGRGTPIRGGMGGGITVGLGVLAVALLALVAVLSFWLDVYYGAAGRFGAGVPASGPLAVLFLLAAVAGIGWVARRLRPMRGHLLAIYCIVLAGAPLVSTTVLANMLAQSTIQRYMAARIVEWQRSFIPLVPSWFGPTEWPAIEAFYRGPSPVPWGVWWTPLAWWCSFLLALAVCSVCVVVLLQRQWVSHERLSFPLALIPLEVAQEAKEANAGASRRRARLPAASSFWIGLGLCLGLNVLNVLARHFPVLPAVPLGPVPIMRWRPVGPAAGLGEIDFVIWPWLIGIAYLIPKELSFSCWFFWFVRLGLTVVGIAAGSTARRPELWWSTEFPASVYQGVGALFAIGLWSVWTARHHLCRVIRGALGRRPASRDADDPVPYTWCTMGLLISFGWLVYFCWRAGSRIGFGAALILLILVYYVTWARLRAETGLGFLPYPFFPHEVIAVPFGTALFRPREVVMLVAPHWSYFAGGGNLEVVAGNVLESMKIADVARIDKRRLLIGMAAAFLLVLPLGVYVTLTGIYRHGFYELHAGQDRAILHWYSWYAHEYITSPRGPDRAGTGAIAAGALAALFLTQMRARFWWWPFHPVGYLAAFTWGMHLYYMPFFVGWAAKALTVRYGGLRLYRRLMPAAVGLVAGDLLNEVLWGVISLATGRRW